MPPVGGAIYQVQINRYDMAKVFKAGYTIIEVLVALSIAGMLFGSGFVSLREFSRRQAVTSAGRTLNGDLRQTQGYALIGKKPLGTICDTTTLIGYDFYVSSSTQYQIRARCTGGTVDVKTVDLESGVQISNPSPNPVVFNALGEGTNVSASTTITLSQLLTGNVITVTITQAGEIK